MIPSNLAPLANHLLQSTLFAAAAGLLVLALRKNYAPARHWLWLAASVKFLIPFSLLITLGAHMPVRIYKQEVRRFSIVVESKKAGSLPVGFPLGLTEPEPPRTPPALPPSTLAILFAIWFAGCAGVLVSWSVRSRRVKGAMATAVPLREGREFDALRRLERAGGIRKPIELLASETSLEPGIFGVFRPVLLLPAGISDRLADAQLDAILAHELCHVRRRDNLAGAIHMVVEALFWFHPLVWWLGSRLVEERERSCDEAVLRLGSEPQAYAESILKVCEFYLESPLVCASGVTGADLKKRIEDIMTHRISHKLDLSKKAVLAAFGMAAVAGPLIFGLMNAPKIRAQEAAASAPTEFEVASIKPGDPGSNRVQIGIAPGGRFTAANVTVSMLIQQAYNVKNFQVTGGPGWVASDRFVINAKAEGAGQGPGAIRPLLQKLLADRFQLVFHKETKEMPVYELVIGKGGSKLQETKESPGPQIRFGRGQINGQSMAMELLANQLANQLGRSVVDKTGLKGGYDVNLTWTPDPSQGGGGPFGGPGGPGGGGPDGAPPTEAGPSLFTALQEQLGLKLESGKGPVEIMVLDKVQKPSEN
jgi:bla regulator protein BlaR1